MLICDLFFNLVSSLVLISVQCWPQNWLRSLSYFSISWSNFLGLLLFISSFTILHNWPVKPCRSWVFFAGTSKTFFVEAFNFFAIYKESYSDFLFILVKFLTIYVFQGFFFHFIQVVQCIVIYFLIISLLSICCL